MQDTDEAFDEELARDMYNEIISKRYDEIYDEIMYEEKNYREWSMQLEKEIKEEERRARALQKRRQMKRRRPATDVKR